jgi:hypothetical protein
MPVLNDADALSLGTQAVAAVYAGANKVWPSGWSPDALPGLTVWLDASQLALADGATVSPWPNLADATKPGTMVGTPAPTVRANALKGQRVVRFTASQGRMRMTGTGVTRDWTVAYIGRYWGTTPGRILCGNYPQSNSLWGWWTSYMDLAHEGPVGFYTPDARRPVTQEWMLYSADAASAPSYLPRFFIDGVYRSTAPSGGGGLAGTLNISGYDATGTQETSDTEVAEVVLYNRKLSDADRQTVEDYLRGKWL